jgi:methylenetetrahydrofolate--tRNA-(uracil-5-)-methyltransferase
MTPAHRTAGFAELVCSNSLRGNALDQAPGLLKEELRRLGSLVVRAADETRVPAGSALAVDRALFSERITAAVCSAPNVSVRRTEMQAIPADGVVVVATGPLTSDRLAADLATLVGEAHLFFFDAVSPVIEADSILLDRCFRASRYGKGGSDDYINCPLTEEEYRRFRQALLEAERVRPRDFEQGHFFEGCLPIEVLAERGPDTLLFGPMKPVGLTDPRTGRQPYAVVQLRQDNLAASLYSLVGFQTQLVRGEQVRVLRLIPALAGARFERYGMVHRNTYVRAPGLLDATFEVRRRPGLFIAGQLSGVEGYVESTASGLVAGLGAAARALGRQPVALPKDTAVGSLGRFVSEGDPRHFQPSNVTFGLLPECADRVRGGRRMRRLAQAARALDSLAQHLAEAGPYGDSAGVVRA